MTKYKGEQYQSPFSDCAKRKCFVPFAGNGNPICRKWELGQCTGKWNDKIKKGKVK